MSETVIDRLVDIRRDLPHIHVMMPDELREYIRESVPFLLDQITRYRTELERIAACEPAHRDRVLRVLAGGEVGE